MGEIIGTPEAARILGVAEITVIRQAKASKLQYLAVVNKKQYIFTRAYIERVARERGAQQVEAVA